MTDSPDSEDSEALAGWRLVVDPGADGMRLDCFVALRVRRLSRARAARLVVVDLDDPKRHMKKASAVHAGQRLWVRRPLPDAGARPPLPTVLHTDADLLVLDKPAGLAIHPTASRFVATVTHWLQAMTPDGAAVPRPGHRLDVETSGLLICAQHALADRQLKAAFAEDGGVLKTYRAVVEGLPPRDKWMETAALGFVSEGLGSESAVRLKMGPGVLPAATAFQVLARGRQRALVEARPRTGRQHQIRVHLAMAGFPIVGDKLYGPDEGLFLASLDRELDADELAILGSPRHALHAWRLEVTWRGERRHFEAPWPDDLQALLT